MSNKGVLLFYLFQLTLLATCEHFWMLKSQMALKWNLCGVEFVSSALTSSFSFCQVRLWINMCQVAMKTNKILYGLHFYNRNNAYSSTTIAKVRRFPLYCVNMYFLLYLCFPYSFIIRSREVMWRMAYYQMFVILDWMLDEIIPCNLAWEFVVMWNFWCTENSLQILITLNKKWNLYHKF